MRKLTQFFARKLSSVKSGFAFISKAKKSFYKEAKENNSCAKDGAVGGREIGGNTFALSFFLLTNCHKDFLIRDWQLGLILTGTTMIGLLIGIRFEKWYNKVNRF